MSLIPTEILDVIVVGAGAAGLTAAYDIHHETNFKYMILEASSGVYTGKLAMRLKQF